MKDVLAVIQARINPSGSRSGARVSNLRMVAQRGTSVEISPGVRRNQHLLLQSQFRFPTDKVDTASFAKL